MAVNTYHYNLGSCSKTFWSPMLSGRPSTIADKDYSLRGTRQWVESLAALLLARRFEAGAT